MIRSPSQWPGTAHCEIEIMPVIRVVALVGIAAGLAFAPAAQIGGG